VKLVSEWHHTCALFSDNVVKCWGEIPSLSLQPTTLQLEAGRHAVDMTGGLYHMCALLDNGAVRCWGKNDKCQLGLGRPGDSDLTTFDSVDFGSKRKALRLASGQYHTCALLDDKQVKCWGDNSQGALGVGDQTNRGCDPDEMGDRLQPVNFGTGLTAVQLAAENQGVCALLNDGSVKCWGLPTRDFCAAFGHLPPVLDPSTAPTVDLGSARTAVQLFSGFYGTCARLDDDTFKCWGQMNVRNHARLDTYVAGEWAGCMCEMDVNTAFGSGRKPVAIGLGADFGCAKLDDDTIQCWGSSDKGQLGQGNTDRVFKAPVAVDLGTGLTATGPFVVGALHSCAVLSNGETKCWGFNQYGALGNGDTVNRGDQPGQMGNALPALDFSD